MKKAPTRKGEDTKRHIVQVARALLVKDGPGALSLRAVAARAEVSLGNLQHHLPDLDALLTAMLDTEIDDALTHIARLQADAVSPIDAALDFLLEQQRDPASTKLFFSLWAFAVGKPQVARALRAFYARFIEHVAAHISARGSHSDDDALERAWSFVALLEGAAVLRSIERQPARHDAVLRRALRALLTD